jgi:hypothetical protein
MNPVKDTKKWELQQKLKSNMTKNTLKQSKSEFSLGGFSTASIQGNKANTDFYRLGLKKASTSMLRVPLL